jgi:hypothetical protein
MAGKLFDSQGILLSQRRVIEAGEPKPFVGEKVS